MTQLISKLYKALLVTESGVKRYFINTSVVLGGRIFQMVVSLVVGAWMARYLGPSDYGIYNYVISFTGIFAALSTLGIGAVITRDMVSGVKKEPEALGSGFMLKLAGSAVAFFLIVLCSMLLDDARATRWLLWIAAFQTILRSTEILQTYFQARVASRRAVQAQMFSLVITTALKVCFILGGKSLIWFVWLLPLDAFLIGSALVYFVRNEPASVSFWKPSKSYAINLLRESWPSLFSGLFVTIYMKIDQVMLQSMLGSAEVGQYAAAVRLSEVWITIPYIISTSLFPAMVKAYQTGTDIFRTRINQAYILLMALALGIAIPICFLSDPIIAILFGSVYEPAAGVLQLHIFSCFFIFIGAITNRWLILQNRQIYWMINSGLGAVANIGLNVLLIPAYGIYGAAWATLISYGFAYYFAFALFKATRPLFVSQSANMLRLFLIKPAWQEIKKLPFRPQ